MAVETTFGDIRAEVGPWSTHLQAEHKSPRTVESYADSLRQLGEYLAGNGMPTQASAIRREHIEAYLLDLSNRGRSPATVALRFRSLRVFFNYMAWHGNNRMERLNLPTFAQGGFR